MKKFALILIVLISSISIIQAQNNKELENERVAYYYSSNEGINDKTVNDTTVFESLLTKDRYENKNSTYTFDDVNNIIEISSFVNVFNSDIEGTTSFKEKYQSQKNKVFLSLSDVDDVLSFMDIYTLELTVFLEGSFNDTDMTTNLNPDLIPMAQPYSNPQKWNYQGTESVLNIPNADIVDWVLGGIKGNIRRCCNRNS